VSRTDGPKVSVVIPACDDALSLYFVLRRLPAAYEVIVVDGGSSDGTPEAARAARRDVRVLTQARAGRGHALATGFRAASGDVLVTFAADGSCDPGDIERYVSALVAGADAVRGCRPADPHPAARLVRGAYRLLFGRRALDLGTGMHALWADVLPYLDLPDSYAAGEAVWGDGDEIDLLIACRLAGLAVAERTAVVHPPIFTGADAAGPAYGERLGALSALLRERTLAADRGREMRELTELIDVIEHGPGKDVLAA